MYNTPVLLSTARNDDLGQIVADAADHELDFSSLYPNIMIEHNVSPETVLCDCHPDREDVPELGYNICDERGFIPDVLEPIVDDRDTIKEQIREL